MYNTQQSNVNFNGVCRTDGLSICTDCIFRPINYKSTTGGINYYYDKNMICLMKNKEANQNYCDCYAGRDKPVLLEDR